MNKKILFILLCLLSIIGCTPKEQNKQEHSIDLKVDKIEFDKILDKQQIEYEVFNLKDDKVILNELDTYHNPLLFTSLSLVTLDQDGKLLKDYKVKTNKRIVDAIEYEEQLFYFNLVAKKNTYFIELCTLENDVEKIIKSFQLDDPYGYPRFVQFGNQVYFKIDEKLYSMDYLDKAIDVESDFYFSKENKYNSTVYLSKLKDSGNELCLLKNNKIETIKIPMKTLGNFVVINDKIIYEDNNHLHAYDLTKEKSYVLFDKEKIEDYTLLKDQFILLHTLNNISIIDLKTNTIVKEISKKEIDIEDTTLWIHSNGNNIVYLDGSNCLYKLTLTIN